MKRITLLYPHTHAGTPHATGVTLSLPDRAADWLIARGVAELATTSRTVTVPAATKTENPITPVAQTPAAMADVATRDNAAPLAPTGEAP